MVDILHKVGIEAAPSAVYAALTTRDGLAGWWTTNTRGDAGTVGGVIEFRFSVDGIEVGGCDARVVELAPNRQVLWQIVGGPDEWVGTKVAFELRQEGGSCVVLFIHRGWKAPSEFMHHCSTKWAVFMLSLKSLVETGKGTPNPDDPRIDERS